MKRAKIKLILIACLLSCPSISAADDWSQWGKDAQHNGQVKAVGQSADVILAQKKYDPHAAVEKKLLSDLLVHYQSVLLGADDVLMEFKGGKFTDQSKWETQEWSERRFQWENGKLIERWRFISDWKPVPFTDSGNGPFWEPVFHAALAGDVVYIPGFGGTVYKVRRTDGQLLARLNPFGTKINRNIFVSGPLSVFKNSVYYNALELHARQPWGTDAVNSWLVQIGADGKINKATFASLTSGTPKPTDSCGQAACGSQRPGINIAPAIAPNGIIYTISRAHFTDASCFLIAVRPDLKTRWITPIGVPSNSTDVQQSGHVLDIASSSPVVAPDGSILYGAETFLMHFSRMGKFLAAYPFGWDITPAIYRHDGTYSIVIKDNDYANQNYRITQLSKHLEIEWQYKNTNTLSCKRYPNGTVKCKNDHPNSFEWCINAPAIDSDGNVFANSEDGNLYVIQQGGILRQKIFLNLALGAAYTPLSIDSAGRIYAQNFGRLLAIGKK